MSVEPTDADRKRAAELLSEWGMERTNEGALSVRRFAYPDEWTESIAAALAQAREEGRQSVGLGDFMPDPCDEEERAPNYHFVENYGDWLPCTKGRGHDGEHEHSDSGFTWSQ